VKYGLCQAKKASTWGAPAVLAGNFFLASATTILVYSVVISIISISLCLAGWIIFPALNDDFKRSVGLLPKASAGAAVFVTPKYVATEIDKMPEISEEEED